jgi:hypothetical protein
MAPVQNVQADSSVAGQVEAAKKLAESAPSGVKAPEARSASSAADTVEWSAAGKAASRKAQEAVLEEGRETRAQQGQEAVRGEEAAKGVLTQQLASRTLFG